MAEKPYELESFYGHLIGQDFRPTGVKDFRAIVVHHSATPDNPQGWSWGAIKKYHVETNGWKDIGYHFGVELADGRPRYLLGRPLTEWGAHTKNWNSGHHASIGLCVVGSYDKEPPPKNVWDTAVYMVQALVKVFKDKRDVDLFVVGHRETYHPKPPEKSCPGWAFDLDQFRKEVFGA